MPVVVFGLAETTLRCCPAHPGSSEQAYYPDKTDVSCHQSHPYLRYLPFYPSEGGPNQLMPKIPPNLVVPMIQTGQIAQARGHFPAETGY